MEELMEIEVNDNRIRLHDFLMFQAQYDIKLKEKNKEIERLNNIINELEKWLEEDEEKAMNNFECGRCFNMYHILDKIKELRGDKE